MEKNSRLYISMLMTKSDIGWSIDLKFLFEVFTLIILKYHYRSIYNFTQFMRLKHHIFWQSSLI